MSRVARRLFGALLVTLVACPVVIALASPALAQDDGSNTASDDQVVLTGDLVVPKGETVGTALIFNGRATIEGTVRETLVVFNGPAEISGTVGEDVVVFNGRVLIRSGAEIGGDVVSRQRPEIEQGATIRGAQRGVAGRFDLGSWFVTRLAWWIGYTVSTLVLGLLIFLLAPALDPAIADTFQRRTGASFGIGAAVFFLLPVVAILFLVVVVAIPLGVFLLLALALLYTVGYVAGAHALGRVLVKPPTSRFVAFLAGWGILRLVALIPVLGGLAWVIASLAGLGILTLAAKRTPPPVPVGTPPPPPAPVVA